MRFEFEWALTSDDGERWTVVERLAGTSLQNIYGPFRKSICEGIIKARRAFVNRTITSRTQAIQVFEPRPALEALRILQAKGHLDA